jgi:hypothetical protein
MLSEGGKFCLTDTAKKYENFWATVVKKDLGDNWKIIKDTARIEQTEFLEEIANKFRKIFDNGVNTYWYCMWHSLTCHAKLFSEIK